MPFLIVDNALFVTQINSLLLIQSIIGMLFQNRIFCTGFSIFVIENWVFQILVPLAECKVIK